MAELKALLFDVDGTLADTERAHLAAFNAAFREAGMTWDWSLELYNELLAVSGGKERMKHYLDNWRADFPEVSDIKAYIASLHRAKTAHYTRYVSEGKLALRPGVKRIMQEAMDQGIKLAIATTTSFANVEALVKYSIDEDAMSWFDTIGAAEQAPIKKPEPDVYEFVMAELGVSADECVAFEDSSNGLTAAKAANLPTIITKNYFTETHDFTGADIVLDNLGEPDQSCDVIHSRVSLNGYVSVDTLRSLVA